MKEPLKDRLARAYRSDSHSEGRDLMEGYQPAQMRAAYAAIEEVEGHAAKCAAQRGEYTRFARWLGIC